MSKYVREPFPALSHLGGAVLSIAGLILLIERSGASSRALVGSAVFGTSLVLLYVASFLTHGIHCSEEQVSRLERFDNAAIFLLIAGTYTPLCLLVLRGPLGWTLLSIEWLLAACGTYFVLLKPQLSKSVRVAIYLTMGWLCLFALRSLISAVPNSLLAWLMGGGLFYSAGTIFFLTNRPTVWRGYLGAHDLWHLCVLGGSVCHFIFVNDYLLILPT